MSRFRRIVALSALLLSHTLGLTITHEDIFHDNDLLSYVTMPDVKAPRFNITIHDPQRVSSGYWFLGPYTSADPLPHIENYMPHQIGANIYDGNGELVWSGAHLYKDRAVFDFKCTNVDGKYLLSFIVNYDPWSTHVRDGTAMVLDSSYQIHHSVNLPRPTFNMHELNVMDNGTSAIVITSKGTSTPFKPDGPKRPIADNGFEEIELATGNKLFEWSALDHIAASDSKNRQPYVTSTNAWDFVHLNSVDKSKVNGDYVISSRYTDAIYRVSHEDGSIVWRFGGKNTSFSIPSEMRSMAQHDARILEETDTTTVISFLNNGADDSRRSRPYSCGYIVSLDTETWAATILHTYDRPDHGTTHGRGNFQVMPNKNVFANWAGNAYFSEFTPEGDVVMEANFSTPRYVTYRAYKFDFEADPTDRPAMKSFGSVTAKGQVATVFYVSWNGATRVKSWNFYSCRNERCALPTFLGTAARTGFETNITLSGLHELVYAEAVNSDGQPLRESVVSHTTVSNLSFVEPEDHSGYSTLMQRLLVLSFIATVLTVGWSFFQRRRFKLGLDVWRDSEKQSSGRPL